MTALVPIRCPDCNRLDTKASIGSFLECVCDRCKARFLARVDPDGRVRSLVTERR